MEASTKKGGSCTVHRVPARIENDEERFAAIASPPKGKHRWTPDDMPATASRAPVSVGDSGTEAARNTRGGYIADPEEIPPSGIGDSYVSPNRTSQSPPLDGARPHSPGPVRGHHGHVHHRCRSPQDAG
ncbi:DUF6192 family protein [Streptomyces sp. NBC_01433]|uniref:DUF6192 family protein n=1 Tax=Streptomyces sp. NBC_01433 TaxID=2903864 RepID=UPI00224E03CF|nr:DUF6192 family protein [Streptomyces sp. NBC_01433]MCX4680996.1 DUF6192 family protein [Streptomyces sp. NBC_01433]